jgi:phosphoglycolate phosphatase
MSLKLAIWDMDGTIVDSREVISTSMVRAFEAVGLIPPTYDETRQIVGLALEEACRRLAPERTSEETLTHLVEAYRQAFIARRTEEDFREPLYDGAVETLERLANDNWLIAMATGKSRRGIDAIFSMHPLAQYFDTIHCADDGPGKPHPAMCLEAMKKMGAEPHESLMIGDAVFVGDTLFQPDVGSARCDFPGGDAATLYESVRKLYALGDATRMFVCHDYPPAGREARCETTVAAQRSGNVHLRDEVDLDAFVDMRTTRDAGLAMPKLILPSIQVNIRAGELPVPEDNGVSYLKLPLDML